MGAFRLNTSSFSLATFTTLTVPAINWFHPYRTHSLDYIAAFQFTPPCRSAAETFEYAPETRANALSFQQVRLFISEILFTSMSCVHNCNCVITRPSCRQQEEGMCTVPTPTLLLLLQLLLLPPPPLCEASEQASCEVQD